MAIKGSTKVEFDFDDEVKQNIEVALAEALNRKSGDITKQLVKAALEKTGEGGYGRSRGQTMLQEAIENAIQTEARNQVNKWVDEHKAAIALAVESEVHKMLTPGLIAENVLSMLDKCQVSLKPLGKKASKAPLLDDEEE